MFITFAKIIQQYNNHPKAFQLIYFLSKKVKTLDDYFSHRDIKIDFSEKKFKETFIKISEQSIPIERIFKFTLFQNKKFWVYKKVFIPRWETEFLIEKINQIIEKHSNINSLKHYIDICSGTGIIGISVSLKNKNLQSTTLLDISKIATKNIKKNLNFHQIKANVICDNWQHYLKTSSNFQIITANFPYINEQEAYDKEILRHEPHKALFAINNGWEHYEKLFIFLKENKQWQIVGCECSEFHLKQWKEIQKNYPEYLFEFFNDQNNKFRVAIITRK